MFLLIIRLSTNNTPPAPALPTCETNNNTSDVTHSFANRKRSIVKRRKSVLSASYTAQDEAEAIKSDREATLAALERGTTMQNSSDEDSIKDNIMIEGNTHKRCNKIIIFIPLCIFMLPK